ncbi:NlpC/P60 family protein [Streptomyces sp. NPDC057681]|uniref:bifunctional lytic transglycosylase/C40 family peptidase n=1 Tax=Streptomyces sp. NPDC057681 TaxID=3346209 RepID=UPI0036A28A54
MSAGRGAVFLITGSFTAIAAFVLGVGVYSGVAEEDDPKPDGAVSGELNTAKVPTKYRPWVIKAAETCDEVTAPVISAQIEAESGWNPHAESPVGARGLSQFMPGTWESHKVDADGHGASVWSGPDSIMTQAAYDCELLGQVKGVNGDPVRLMLAAYNAGPGAVQQYGGVPPYPETQEYVRRIMSLVPKYSKSDGGGASMHGTFGQRIAAQAKSQIGVPYSWGGGGPEGPSRGIQHGSGIVGYDCSGLVQYAVYQASKGKIAMPRSSQAQAVTGKAVSRGDIRTGDLIAFAMHGAGNYDHIGIYIGGGQFVHAPRTGQDVKISELSDNDQFPMAIRRLR